MVTLRATKKLRRYLGPVTASDDAKPDTALGDWYADRIVIGRQPLVLLISSGSRLAILDMGRDLKHLPDRLPDLVERRLSRLETEPIPQTGVVSKKPNPAWVRREVAALAPVHVGNTVDRSVVGQLVNFVTELPYRLEGLPLSPSTLLMIEDKLQRNPCRASHRDGFFPDKLTLELLENPPTRTE